MFLWPKLSEDAITRYYADAAFYDAAESRADRLRESYRSRLLVLNHLATRFGLAKDVLDIGCATGHFLDEASRSGWNARGLEISPALAAKARARYGVEVAVCAPEQFRSEGPFPVMTAWEVLEHLRDPKRFLGTIRRLILPGGLFALSTPLSDGLPARIMGDKFPMLLPQEHLSLFSTKSIRILLGEWGFDIVHSDSFSNLDAQGLASGMARMLGYEKGKSLPKAVELLTRGAGAALSFLPHLVDKAGLGSEVFLVAVARGK